MDRSRGDFVVEDGISEQELKLLELIRSMEDGEVSVRIANGKLVRIEEVQKGIEL